MKFDLGIPSKTWIKTLPISKMVYPSSLIERFKYYLWRLYTPLHGTCRDILLKSGIIRHEGRQKFLIGKIAPGVTIEQFISFLVSKGYGNHFIAWKDDGEILSLRYVEDFVYQYHVRVFADGEVRAHYEYTPESHPIKHLRGTSVENRNEAFIKLLGNLIVVDSSSE